MKRDYSELFLHETDKKALAALKAIPGFTPLLKEFIKGFDEKQFRLINMSTNIRINEKQMPKYYNMLLPICEKLGIEVPELYLSRDVEPNAYTYGDSKPFIVMTSGLLETMPEHLIPTVLAHECGHIACHHTLYKTMARILLSGLLSGLGVGGLVTIPIQAALAYWNRCSEFSADRAAIVCDGNADNMIDLCARFAGYNTNNSEQLNLEEFMNQANEYKELISESKFNKAMESFMMMNNTHPLNAIRASEARDWASNEDFGKIIKYFNNDNDLEAVYVCHDSDHYIGMVKEDVREQFQQQGFTNIELASSFESIKRLNTNDVCRVTINGKDDFQRGQWYDSNARVVIYYYKPLTEMFTTRKEVERVKTPDAARRLLGRNYLEVVKLFEEAGFINVVPVRIGVPKRSVTTEVEGGVAKVSVNGSSQFEKDIWVDCNVEVRVVYNAFV